MNRAIDAAAFFIVCDGVQDLQTDGRGPPSIFMSAAASWLSLLDVS